jgi:hypothetical protein
VVLLFLAVPKFVGALVALPGDRHLDSLRFGRAVGQKELESLAESRLEAAPWSHDGRVLTDLGLALMAQAIQAGTATAEGSALVERSLDAHRAGLARSPASPQAWARHAQALALAGRPDAEILAALRMSLLSGPQEPALVIPRLALAARSRLGWDVEMVDLVRTQIRIAWTFNRAALARSAATYDYLDLVRASLAEAPDQLAALERLLARRS